MELFSEAFIEQQVNGEHVHGEGVIVPSPAEVYHPTPFQVLQKRFPHKQSRAKEKHKNEH